MYVPGFTNTARAEASIENDLGRTACRYVVLDKAYSEFSESANDSRLPGSADLNEYISAHYRIVLALPDVVVEERQP